MACAWAPGHRLAAALPVSSTTPTLPVFESHGVKVVVDKQSLQPIDGPEVDCLKSNALNEGFEFRNPDTRDTCGCGESFGV